MTVDMTGIPVGTSPPGAEAPAGDPAPQQASLSPSRAADFKTCPLLYRFRCIDRLPERPSPDQARGTLVHAVLERLFDLAPAQRTPAAAAALVAPAWQDLVEATPALLAVFEPDGGGQDPEGFLTSARDLLGGYFAVEDPTRLTPAQREALVSTTIDDGRLLLRGYIDRLDVSAAGDLRVVDYKTGGAPREAFEARALFQLKFYALVLWRSGGVAPRMLRLLYLRDAEVCDYAPDVEELERFERTLVALWAAIRTATEQRDFRPRPSRLCGWCAHQARCPAYGGTPPPFPEPAAVPVGDGPPGPGDPWPTGTVGGTPVAPVDPVSSGPGD